MQFEWDDNKAKTNLLKHNVEFEFAKQLFNNPRTVIKTTQSANGEERFTIIGYIDLKAYIVVFTHVKREQMSPNLSPKRNKTRTEKASCLNHKS